MKLWRDYVIATLAIDGTIVFCFALASKLRSAEGQSSQQFELVGEEHRGYYEGYMRVLREFLMRVSRAAFRKLTPSAPRRFDSRGIARDYAFGCTRQVQPSSSAINSDTGSSRANAGHRLADLTGACCRALRYNVQCRRGSILQWAIAPPARRAIHRVLPR
ncbi:hypothetical protein SBC2_01610 [Caballeronia sp. SBC2]|nr:hypothetical protein SBC2_01610 [Caballeronia sp. SBC2]